MTHADIVALVGGFIGPAIIPTTAIIISIFRADSRSNRLDAKIDSLGNRLDAKIDTKVDGLTTRLDSKVDGLRADIRGDMSILDGITYDHHGRLTRIETESNPEK